MKRECHKECEGNSYCFVEAHAKFHLENQEKLYPSKNPPENGIWKDTAFVHKHTVLYYCGIGVHLDPDGKYFLEDTAGG